MSIDSVQARFSVVGVNGPYLIGAYPDATVPEVWRLASGWCYAGNELVARTAVALGSRVLDTLTWEIPTDTLSWNIHLDTLTWEIETDTTRP